jgi:hypothetical protein
MRSFINYLWGNDWLNLIGLPKVFMSSLQFLCDCLLPHPYLIAFHDHLSISFNNAYCRSQMKCLPFLALQPDSWPSWPPFSSSNLTYVLPPNAGFLYWAIWCSSRNSSSHLFLIFSANLICSRLPPPKFILGYVSNILTTFTAHCNLLTCFYHILQTPLTSTGLDILRRILLSMLMISGLELYKSVHISLPYITVGQMSVVLTAVVAPLSWLACCVNQR